jgi:hypothetical protein
MKYTKHFASLTKENGQLNLSTEQFRRMMNIVSSEGIINGMNRIKEKYKGTQYYYKYDLDIFKHQKVLINLTGNLQAEDLFREMHMLNGDCQ